jgi:molecular chaperone GrpE
MSSNLEQDPVGQATAGTSPGAGDAAEGLEAELATAQAQLQDAREAQLRALAEMENVRKRAQRDVEAAHRFAVERFAADMIDVRDTLELGIAAAVAATEAGKLVEGMQATLRMLDKAFEKAGIVVLDPVGQVFNPEFHEAMVAQPSAEHPPGSVLAVVQKGFTLNGRLLRAARVVIAREADTSH